jgi:hypothetical protein
MATTDMSLDMNILKLRIRPDAPVRLHHTLQGQHATALTVTNSVLAANPPLASPISDEAAPATEVSGSALPVSSSLGGLHSL